MENKIKLIYNPHAGKKRKFVGGNSYSLEDIKKYLDKYQLSVDFFPTKKAGHATQLAIESIKEGYKTVIAAGGDGTISEVANGLINSDIHLGIIPLGTFMNTARMLSIPFELEKAIMLLKIGRTRKIDIGSITKLNGDKLITPSYFLENSGIGLDAQLNKDFLKFEKGDLLKLLGMLKLAYSFYLDKVTICIDDEEFQTRSTFISVSNAPYTGAGLNIAPEAKLNDHRLTVTLRKMKNWEILLYLLNWEELIPNRSSKERTYQAKKVTVRHRKLPIPVHADARVFGTTPVEYSVIPNALNVICGFPDSSDESASLLKRTVLDP